MCKDKRGDDLEMVMEEAAVWLGSTDVSYSSPERLLASLARHICRMGKGRSTGQVFSITGHAAYLGSTEPELPRCFGCHVWRHVLQMFMLAVVHSQVRKHWD